MGVSLPSSGAAGRSTPLLRFLDSLPIEFHRGTGAIDLERAVRSDGVGANEDPVLPGGKTAEDAGFEGFRVAEAKIGFEAGECVGRERSAGLDGLAKFVFPVKIV